MEDELFEFLMICRRRVEQLEEQNFNFLKSLRPTKGIQKSHSTPVKCGKGIPSLCQKADYVRTGSLGYYEFVRNHHNPKLFESQVHMSRENFDALFSISRSNLEKPMNVRLDVDEEMNEARIRRKRILSEKEMLFFYFFCSEVEQKDQ